jgi:hypothetical protein
VRSRQAKEQPRTLVGRSVGTRGLLTRYGGAVLKVEYVRRIDGPRAALQVLAYGVGYVLLVAKFRMARSFAAIADAIHASTSRSEGSMLTFRRTACGLRGGQRQEHAYVAQARAYLIRRPRAKPGETCVKLVGI